MTIILTYARAAIKVTTWTTKETADDFVKRISVPAQEELLLLGTVVLHTAFDIVTSVTPVIISAPIIRATTICVVARTEMR